MELYLEQLATHIPDIVIQKPLSDLLIETAHSYGVVVFADISGFTNLCEKYTSGAKSKIDGTDMLTATLNSYLSKIVQGILEGGGDVLKFAGDALLAFWSCSRFAVSGMLNEVLQICLTIQENFDNFQTEDGETLRMKIGLSTGKVELHYIGNKSVRLFDVTGEAIEDSNTAQMHTKSGTVVISKLAYEYLLDKDKCIIKLVGPGYAQVSSLKAGDKDSSNTDISEKRRKITIFSMQGDKPKNAKSNKTNVMIRGTGSLPISCQKGLNFRCKIMDTLALLSPQAQQELRSYIIPTVLHKIDRGHEVGWFSELREVSVLFINLNPGTPLGASETLHLLQGSFNSVYPSLLKYNGTLNKVFMFDKGCTFLCIFGLPHTRHEECTTSSLRAARDIFNALHDLELDGHYSMGVTTGLAFCGVVGHPQRHEYTVIGQKVNMAARLMMKFQNCIACDEVTKTKSALSSNQFELKPVTALKGISNPENIYQLSLQHIEKDSGWDVCMATDADELIGRTEEMQVLFKELVHVSEHTHRDTGVIIITGVAGIGKTKLLRAMKAKAAMMKFRVVSGIGGLIEQNTPFFTVKTLVNKLLHIDTCKNIHEREQLLLQHITDSKMRELLPLLNDLLVLKFPQTETTAELVLTEDRTKALHKLLFSMVHQEALMKPCVFGIDDAHWIDSDSWLFLLDLIREPNAVLILTTRPLNEIEKPPALTQILEYPNTKVLKLDGLSPDHMVELTCQLLSVTSIPEDLQDIVNKKSHGVPLWCEELVETMLELQYLKIIEADENEPDDGSEQKCGRVVKLIVQDSLAASINGVEDIPIPDSVTGMVLARIDHMSADDQMTLKCAAIIGTSFTKGMLEAIIPNCNPVQFHKSLNTLAEAGIIECSVAAKMKTILIEETDDTIQSTVSKLQCSCLEKIEHPLAQKGHASYLPVDNCNDLQFVHHYVQETTYNLFTEAQRKQLHQAAAHFLESKAHKCKNCGGGDFMGGRHSSISKRKNITRKAFHGAGGARLQTAKERARANSSVSIEGNNPDQNKNDCSEADTFNRDKRPSMASVKVSGSNTMLDIDMQECHCDHVLASVYPQLVRHWRAAGEPHNTMVYLIEEASAAVATYNNMEATSLLQEAIVLTTQIEPNVVTNQELGRIQSLLGQALYQMGQVEESMKHFYQALRLLHYKLPRTIIGGSFVLVHQSIKQFLHYKLPFNATVNLNKDEPFLERARCLAHISHSYRLQNRNIMGLMTSLKRLNDAELAQEYHVHEVMEAYAGMIEYCQQLHYDKLASHYFNKAMAYCVGIDFSVEDIHGYAHLLFVGLSLQFYKGNVSEALSIGTASYNAIKKKHDASMEFCTLPLLFFTNMACFNRSVSGDLLKELNMVTNEANDLRAHALYDCCHFDALLEFGIDWQSENMTVTKADGCCTDRDVYYFDEEERYFLVSCLGLWHARKGNHTIAKKYAAIAQDLQPQYFRTYLAAKAHSRYTEIFLLLMRNLPTKKTIVDTEKALKKFKQVLNRFGIFQSRYHHFKAYYHLLKNRPSKAKHRLNEAFIEANRCGCLYDAEWCLQSKSSWFQNQSCTGLDIEQEMNDNEDTIFMYRFPNI